MSASENGKHLASLLFSELFAAAANPIVVTDGQGIIQDINPAFTTVTGYSRDDVTGRSLRLLGSGREGQALFNTVLRQVARDGRWHGEVRGRGKNGKVYRDVLDMTAIRDNDAVTTHYIGKFADPRWIAEADERERIQGLLASANKRLEELTYIDPMSGLLNRLGFQKMFSHEQARAKREGSTTLAMLLDLDDFKQVNDALGHAVGDLVIKETARTLTDSLRSTDYIARFGGDEFMILLPQTRPAEGERVAEKVRLALSESPLSMSPGPVDVTASFGVIEVPTYASVVDELLSAGHPILAQSKQSGKNRVTYAWRLRPPARGSDQPLDDILNDLRRGDRLKPVAHPILRLEDEEAQGVEFLTRSDIESFEMPIDFFRICTEANILSVVDYHCFKMCLKASASVDESLRRFINILPSTLVNVPVSDLIDAFPKDRAAGRYYIEISEQQVIGDPSYLLEPVRALRNAGIRIAFDDVGYGRSWLESLILLEPHVVKIDRKWINGISTDSSRARALCRMLNVVDSLGAEVIAEGIEDRQDLDALRKLGVKYGQGFLWGRPH